MCKVDQWGDQILKSIYFQTTLAFASNFLRMYNILYSVFVELSLTHSCSCHFHAPNENEPNIK